MQRYRTQKLPYVRLKAFLFFATFFVFMIFSMLLFLRPEKSVLEKRELAKFPECSVSTLLSGTYFDKIDTWFSDTFPAKDFFVTISADVKNLYGYGNRIYGDMTVGDEIPDTPYKGKNTDENTAAGANE